jgi:hypothetical protein
MKRNEIEKPVTVERLANAVRHALGASVSSGT